MTFEEWWNENYSENTNSEKNIAEYAWKNAQLEEEKDIKNKIANIQKTLIMHPEWEFDELQTFIINNIKQIVEVNDIKEVNRLLREDWIILKIITLELSPVNRLKSIKINNCCYVLGSYQRKNSNN